MDWKDLYVLLFFIFLNWKFDFSAKELQGWWDMGPWRHTTEGISVMEHAWSIGPRCYTLIKLGYDCSNSMGFINICLKRSSHFFWVLLYFIYFCLMIVTYICVGTDHNISTTYCCSSSGNSDDLLSMTSTPWLLVIGVSWTLLMDTTAWWRPAVGGWNVAIN